MSKSAILAWCASIGVVCAAVVVLSGTTGTGTGSQAEAAQSVADPPVGLERFGAFKRAAETNVPAALRRFVAEPDVMERFHLDSGQVRRVAAPNKAEAWYLVAGARHLCFYDGNGGSCATIDTAVSGRLLAILMPPPPSPGAPAAAKGPAIGDSQVVVRGIVPDGVTSVDGVTRDGKHSTASVIDGAYEVRGEALSRVEFHGDNAPEPVEVGP